MKRGSILTTLFFILVFGVSSLMADVYVPTGLDDPDATDHNITLTWNDTVGEVGYTIYSVTGVPGSYTYDKVPSAETLGANTVIFTVNSISKGRLKEATKYHFAVTATYYIKDNLVESDYSTPLKAMTTHTWDGALLNCLNGADHTPTRIELENVVDFNCSSKGLTQMEPVNDLKNLFVLDLSNNSIAGSIPSWIGNFTKLLGLDLHGNLFSGDIPAQIWTLTSLEVGMDLSHNDLTGSIPPEIGDLVGIIRGIDLSYNELTGTIPPEIGNLIHMRGLDLGDNNLTGSIPPEIGKLTGMIEGLDLSNNHLSGSIPVEIVDLNITKYLNLHNNHLSGEIPSRITELEALEDGEGLWLDYNCHLYNNDLAVQAFINEKSYSYGSYYGIGATGGNCLNFNLVPVTSYLLD